MFLLMLRMMGFFSGRGRGSGRVKPEPELEAEAGALRWFFLAEKFNKSIMTLSVSKSSACCLVLFPSPVTSSLSLLKDPKSSMVDRMVPVNKKQRKKKKREQRDIV